LGRCGDQDALNAPAHVDERAAVIDRGNLGIGLQRLAPNATDGADDADADGWQRRFLGIESSSQGDWVCPSMISFLGATVGTGNPLASILRSVRRRDLSLAMRFATTGSA